MRLVAYLTDRPRGEEAIAALVTSAVTRAGASVIRLDDNASSAMPPISGVFDALQRASAVVAHIGKDNPNLYYEMGLAHGMGKPLLIVVPVRAKLPVDLQTQRVIRYTGDPATSPQFEFAITEQVRLALSRAPHSDSSAESLYRDHLPQASAPLPDYHPADLLFPGAFEAFVGSLLRDLRDWDVVASPRGAPDQGYDFVAWQQDADSTLRALGNPIGIEVTTRKISRPDLERLIGTARSQGLHGLIVFTSALLSTSQRLQLNSLYEKTGVPVVVIDASDLHYVRTSNDLRVRLSQRLFDLRTL